MTDEETDELGELKDRCLKKDGEPRKDASTEDLQRLKELCEQEVDDEELLPLDADEQEELDKLEAMARKGRSVDQPTPLEMKRLSKLRRRNQ